MWYQLNLGPFLNAERFWNSFKDVTLFESVWNDYSLKVARLPLRFSAIHGSQYRTFVPNNSLSRWPDKCCRLAMQIENDNESLFEVLGMFRINAARWWVWHLLKLACFTFGTPPLLRSNMKNFSCSAWIWWTCLSEPWVSCWTFASVHVTFQLIWWSLYNLSFQILFTSVESRIWLRQDFALERMRLSFRKQVHSSTDKVRKSDLTAKVLLSDWPDG